MSSTVNLIFFGFEDSDPLYNELVAIYKNDDRFEVESMSRADEVGQFIATTGNAIFMFKMKSKVDLQNAVGILKAQKKLIKNGLMKPACVTSIKNKKVEQILGKYGCMDILDPDTKAKTLTFKMDFWAKPIVAHMDKVARDQELKMKKQEAAKKEADKNKPDIAKVAALQLESDFWILKDKNDAKKVLRRWLVKMLGPSTFIGSWVELEPQPGDKLPTWKFVLKDPSNDDFIKNEGAWYFYGSKPDFDWKLNRWNFSSELPHLYFYSADGKVFSRFKLGDGQIEIANNSDFALAREELILETCDTKHNFDGDKAAEEETTELDEEASEELSHLEGKGKTDEISHDSLSGKSSTDDVSTDPLSGKSSTDEYGADPLAGKASTDKYGEDPLAGAVKPGEEKEVSEKKRFDEENSPDGPLAGKSSTDNLGGGPLSGNVKPGEQKEDADPKKGFEEEAKPTGPLAGKSSTDNLGGGPLSGNIKPGEQKEDADKKKGFEEEGKPSGPLAGKSSTDNLGGGPLSGNIKPGEQKERESKDNSFKEDAIPGHMGGKSSTDDVSSDPLSGQLKPGEQKEKDSKDNSFKEDAIPGHMGGKSSTDDVSSDPLSGQLKPGEQKNKETKDNSFKEDAIPGHMGGKSNTDDVSTDPLSGQIKPGEQKNKETKDNSFKEDAIPGHMGGKSSTDDVSTDPLSGKINPASTVKPNDSASSDSELPTGELAGANDQLNPSAHDAPLNPMPSDIGIDPITEPQIGSILPTEDEKKESKPNIADIDVMDGFQPLDEKSSDPVNDQEAKLDPNKTIDNTQTADEHSEDKKVELEALIGEKKEVAKKQLDPSRVIENSAVDDIPYRKKGQIARSMMSSAESKRAEKENEMADALGGGLTEEAQIGSAQTEVEKSNVADLKQIIDNKKQNEIEKASELDEMIGAAPDVNLESGELKVILKQKTEVGNDITFLCEFEDFYEDELSVVAPANSIAVNSMVKAKVSLSYNGQRINVFCEGEVEEKEELSEHKETLIIRIDKIDNTLYEDFIKLYQERQGSINDFMEMAKGY